ncbi:MAG: exosome complex RNA-binding protein Csl4 [Candidatus Freyarchaeota archaeon]|nr:exosome complex RNA-binding protein Csl4 [Candidatus Jordarchaeia archaeon]MBS7270293.1 exosome complex RNA-binding protein Csl4 [Candidatus Jordarchaeia archaeon]
MQGENKPKTGNLVTPGDWLGVIEEFTPGEGTYEENGAVYASTVGRLLIDNVEKRVKVIPIEARALPKKGDIVLGKVTQINKMLTFVDIARVRGHDIANPFSGVIHISQISTEYVENTSDALKPGDIIRARVVEEKGELIQLTTVEKNLGVIYATCSKCGSELERTGNILYCKNCESKETRKIASDYGRVKL